MVLPDGIFLEANYNGWQRWTYEIKKVGMKDCQANITGNIKKQQQQQQQWKELPEERQGQASSPSSQSAATLTVVCTGCLQWRTTGKQYMGTKLSLAEMHVFDLDSVYTCVTDKFVFRGLRECVLLMKTVISLNI